MRRETNAITLGANNITSVCVPDYHCFTNRKRYLEFGKTINASKSRVLISPYFPRHMVKKHYKGQYEELMYINDNNRSFDITDGIIQASCRTTGVLLIAVAIVMGMNRIFLAGMDGYSDLLPTGGVVHHYDEKSTLSGLTAEVKHRLLETERLNEKVLEQISTYMKQNGNEPFAIVTPTVHEKYYRSFDEILRQSV